MSELTRHMGLFHLTMYGVGLILGAGIYVLIGEAAGFAGNSMWISFLLGTEGEDSNEYAYGDSEESEESVRRG